MKTNILVVDTKICSTFTHHSMNSAEMKNNYSIYVTNAPPLGNNTNPDDKLEFVLFFSNEYLA